MAKKGNGDGGTELAVIDAASYPALQQGSDVEEALAELEFVVGHVLPPGAVPAATTTTHNASSINAFVYKGVTGKALTKSPAHNVVDLFSSLPGRDGYIPKSAYNGKNAKYTKAEVNVIGNLPSYSQIP